MKDKKELLHMLKMVMQESENLTKDVPETLWTSPDASFRVVDGIVYMSFHTCEYKVPALESVIAAWRKRLNSQFLTKFNKHWGKDHEEIPNPYKPKRSPIIGKLSDEDHALHTGDL